MVSRVHSCMPVGHDRTAQAVQPDTRRNIQMHLASERFATENSTHLLNLAHVAHISDSNGEVVVFRFFGEQVSHDPPVTAFHLECPQLLITACGNLTIKAKYMGMYVGVSLNGDLVLQVPCGAEEQRTTERYEMAFPMLYLRSFLTEPWMEFGGKININSPESKPTCSVVFQTKPFYGGKPHQVTAEIKATNGSTAARLSGDWMSGALELAWSNGSTEAIGVQAEGGWLAKKVRPIARQSPNESLKVWDAVRQALVAGEYHTAGDLKKAVEISTSTSTLQLQLNVFFLLARTTTAGNGLQLCRLSRIVL